MRASHATVEMILMGPTFVFEDISRKTEMSDKTVLHDCFIFLTILTLVNQTGAYIDRAITNLLM